MTSGLRHVTRAVHLVLLVALAACGSCAIAADNAGGGWGLDQLMQGLARVQSSKARFVERKHLRILNAPLELSGTLVYTAPGHLEKHTLAPKPESLILDGDTLVVEDKTRNRRRTLTLTQYPVVWALVESIRSTLAGDLKTLNRFYRVSLEGNEQQWRLTLEPREIPMQRLLSYIRITGSRSALRQIDVVEAEGDRSLMTITDERQ
jgi:outer membrane lipoprotein-sorting protein